MKSWWGHRSNSSDAKKSKRWYGGVWFRIALVLVVGITISGVAMVIAATVYQGALRTRVNTAAQALGSSRIDSLKDGATSDTTNADYAYEENKLALIKGANADARFVYLMARDDDGSVYFLADSEPENSDGNSPRGEKYPEASVALKSMFDNGKIVIEGPVKDSYGTWLSVLAPVIDEQTYRMTAVIGMDVPASTYGLVIGLAGGGPLLLTILAAVVVFIRYQSWRRRQEDTQFRAEMLSIAGHEIRTPLTGLRWSQETLIKQKVGNDSQQHMLRIMYESTRRLQESIEDILQLASMESGRARRLYLEDVDMRKLLGDITEVQQLAASQNNVTFEFTSDWPAQVVLHVDEQRMKRVFNNVLSNVMKSSSKDAAIIIGFEKPDDGFIISVRDDRTQGMSKDDQLALWSSLDRPSTRERDVTDTDMGLYLARNIIEQHGGRIWLESSDGAGTTVFVKFPKKAAGGSVVEMPTWAKDQTSDTVKTDKTQQGGNQ
jgi:signal transduction histidine kinase/type II secretory pathway pseudopilin PulG